MADLKIDKSRYTVDSLYQWDKNQELKIYGLSMLDPEIHFTNEAMGGSIVVDCTVDESGVISVKVPNSLLQYKYSIVAYIAGFEGDMFKTYHKVTIPVKARKRPGDYTLSLSDNEVYSFKSMSDRITNVEDEIKSEGSILYNYSYDDTNTKLVESSGRKTIGEYIPLVSNSLKAVKGLSDKFKTMIDANTKLGETALSIAKGINSAKVFDTTADMEAWLSDEANKGKCTVGNNLYIVDIDVPDWWIAKVLETPDSETGYYYKIAQLEVQKVDLNPINEDIDTLQEDVEALEGRVDNLENNLSNLGADEVSVDDTNLALGGTTVQDILELINTKIDTEIAKTYDRWWWKDYSKTAKGTAQLDISTLDFQEIEVISKYTKDSIVHMASMSFIKSDITSNMVPHTMSGEVPTGGSRRNVTTFNISRNFIQITEVKHQASGSYGTVTNDTTLSVKYR